ncbi:GspE/PulE family protein [Hyalangium gracile]|uniref:GspE/PulE family protein n=1 Tax=Hyalangium gracile TaxID=394092 RepID=UPI001CC997E2|nr:GspE/PulE family protein [Hyalangium gracile]
MSATSAKATALALLKRCDEIPIADLRSLGFESTEEVARYVAEQLKLPRLELDQVDLVPSLAEVIPRPLAERHKLVPVFVSEDEVTIATAEPARLELFDWLSHELKRQVITVVSSPQEIVRGIKRLYEPLRVLEQAREEALSVSLVAAQQAVAFVNHVILRAVELRASDIHIEAGEKETCIRYRIDGMLRVDQTIPLERHAAIVSRIKVMAQLDISERNVPQDGRIKLQRTTNDIDLRVSILPTYFGEKVCCRILDNSRACLPLSELGFEPGQMATFERLLRMPFGLLLVTGPTGSGKSTTLYGALNTVRSPEVNIVSVEDPVEYQLPGINQVQVNTRRGLTFALALRSILRQDPNVILVGEIRDRETGAIAVEASLTGHLVMASLHTNDAPSAIMRLTEMGIEPCLVAPALMGVVAQRLVRKVCTECAEPHEVSASELASLGLPALPPEVRLCRGRGCARCQNTGYRGRIAVREILELNDSLRMAIARGAQVDELHALAVASGFRAMWFQAMRALCAGVTTLQEVIRVTKG